jgi:quinol monooxygenase YgiN
MYGTVAKMRLKPGAEPAMVALMDDYDSDTVPGFVNTYAFRLDSEPDTYFMVAVFQDKASYQANADSPEQHQRYLQYRELLAAEPEWHDGEIIASRA